ncbi:MAG: 50S ribosomal protein L21 [Minisyncoccia bacterium]|jgi:large subunit ribosomal protein L21
MAQDFAVIQTGGKQYKISAGEKIKIEKTSAEGGAVVFDKVLLRSEGGRVTIGAPYLTNTSVEAELLGMGREKKKIVFKYHSKTRFRKKKGHRQQYTEVRIKKV